MPVILFARRISPGSAFNLMGQAWFLYGFPWQKTRSHKGSSPPVGNALQRQNYRITAARYLGFWQDWLPTVQEVLQADWQDVAHSLQLDWARLFLRVGLMTVIRCWFILAKPLSSPFILALVFSFPSIAQGFARSQPAPGSKGDLLRTLPDKAGPFGF